MVPATSAREMMKDRECIVGRVDSDVGGVM